MLNHDIKNHFLQFANTFSICFQWNTTHTGLVISNYFWLEQLNVCAKYEILSDKYFCFIG